MWAGLFAVLAMQAFLVASSRFDPPVSEPFYRFNSARVERFAAPEAGSSDEAFRVVLLGSSLTKFGTLGQSEMADLAAAAGLGPSRFLRLIRYGVVFSDLAGLAEEILRARPDVIIMQLDLLLHEHGEPMRQQLFRKYLKWLLAGPGPWDADRLDQHELQFNNVCPWEQSEEMWRYLVRDQETLLSYDPAGKSARMARDFVLKAAAAGTHVVLLAYPRTPRMEAFKPLMHPLLIDVVRSLIRSDRISYWRYPGRLPDDAFCDFAHLNRKGQEGFSRWLIDELAALKETTVGRSALLR
jgi:hypothetical protein